MLDKPFIQDALSGLTELFNAAVKTNPLAYQRLVWYRAVSKRNLGHLTLKV